MLIIHLFWVQGASKLKMNTLVFQKKVKIFIYVFIIHFSAATWHILALLPHSKTVLGSICMFSLLYSIVSLWYLFIVKSEILVPELVHNVLLVMNTLANSRIGEENKYLFSSVPFYNHYVHCVSAFASLL